MPIKIIRSSENNIPCSVASQETLRAFYGDILTSSRACGENSSVLPVGAVEGAFDAQECLRTAADAAGEYSASMTVVLSVYEKPAHDSDDLRASLSDFLSRRSAQPELCSAVAGTANSSHAAAPVQCFADALAESSQKVVKKKRSFGFFGASAAPGAKAKREASVAEECEPAEECPEAVFSEGVFNSSGLDERMKHLSDTFSEYLLYLIESRGMENADVYKRAIVDKKTFSKLKNNPDYHPQKLTAMCLCVGAKLNLDETRDLLARAGYALSPCDRTDIIFSYFIENGIYDMIELDIQLEEHGCPCIIV